MARVSYTILFTVVICISGMRAALGMDPQVPFHAFVLDHWGVEQGLPQITVLDIAEDRAGFLWINTQAAVARFDGTRFVTFDRAGTGVDTSMLAVAWADPQGQVWFGGAHGLLRERHGRFIALGGDTVNAIIDAGDGTPLLATAKGLARVRNDRIEAVPGYSGAAFSLLRDGSSLWIGGLGRVCRLDPAASLPAATCVEQGAGSQPVAISRMAGTRRSGLWLGTRLGLMRLDGDRIVPSGLGAGLDTTGIESLLVDRGGTLWIGTVPALYRHLPGGSLEQIGDDDLVRHPWVRALFEDHAGNLWMGTQIDGLYRVWNGWTRRVSSSDGVDDTLVWSIVRAPQGGIVLGTNSGVQLFDGKRVHPLIPGSTLPNPSAYELFHDHRGRLWVGTRAGIAVFDHGRKVTPPALAALDNLRIDNIREVADDDFWIGSSEGLYRWRQGSLVRADPGASSAAAIIRSILPLAPDHLYLGTEDGVREWHDGKLEEPAWARPLRGHFVTRLAMLGPGLLGVATSDAGIGVMVDGQLRMTGQKDGLPSDNAWTLDVIGSDLYVGSIAGAWRLPLAQLPRPGSPARRVAPQRIAGEERSSRVNSGRCCNGGASARSLVDGDIIWYSTTDGALGVDTRALGPLPRPPPAMIESVERAGRQFLDDGFKPHEGARDLAIHYTAPYLHPGTLSFRYRLEGYDTAWQDAGERRIAFYTHLPPGSYRFRVAATVSGASGYGVEADLPIGITPYWYERTWVRLAAILLLGLVVALLLGWSMRSQRRRNAWLEAQVAQRTEQLTRAVERLRVTNLALAEESHTDALTSLHNRRYLLKHLPGVLAADACIGVLQIDIDYFKEINDSYGHAVGDAVLRELGHMLAAARRDSDITVRWGGEEFLLLLADVDAAGALGIAERLRREITAQAFPDGRGGSVRLTCSIGFSMHPLAMHADDHTFEIALELADLALYRAKQEGRNVSVGLVASTPLPADVLCVPFGPQLDALLAAGRLRWVREAS
ncbi:GGDEF domain-containing protein [Rhodanobacter denitrificans]|uniref:diguanylate cyclase n=1 Tax=Rhodanobacter denitrificans TaxID=666685 RepID=A0A368KBA9_9GAMM|nr:ligand-binding sensor domain-containing diguanylate cyclase [Rhodanobacter denitrificans]RCS29221.1 GGDEF domain-containing protein [Rhodanobacter denitrificans]